jgi:hypothetical protein
MHDHVGLSSLDSRGVSKTGIRGFIMYVLNIADPRGVTPVATFAEASKTLE